MCCKEALQLTQWNCGCVCRRGLAASQMVLLTHGDSVATVAQGFTSCAQTMDKTVAGQLSLHIPAMLISS